MPYLFTCKHCQTQTLVDDCYSGQAGRCVTCGQPIQIPGFASNLADTGEASWPANQQGSGAAPRLLTPLGRRLLAAILCGLLLVGGTTAFLRYTRPQLTWFQTYRTRGTSIRNAEKIAAALNAYATDHGTYPPPSVVSPDGQPLLSWRVLLLPYLGHEPLFSRFDLTKPWDAPENLALAIEMPAVYAALPSMGNQQSSYFLITGPGTLFPPAPPGSFRALSPRDVHDDPGQTILVAEARQPNLTGCWTQPGDLHLDQMTGNLGRVQGTEIGGILQGGAVVATVDGRGHFLNEGTPPTSVIALMTIAGGESIPDHILGH